jgi:hypothetical protein
MHCRKNTIINLNKDIICQIQSSRLNGNCVDSYKNHNNVLYSQVRLTFWSILQKHKLFKIHISLYIKFIMFDYYTND